MRRKTLQSIVFVLAVVVLPLACKGRTEAAGESAETQTIPSAAAQPAETGTDAMTQTVELQDGRSEAEGGVLSSPTSTATATTETPVTGTSGSATPPTASTRTQ